MAQQVQTLVQKAIALGSQEASFASADRFDEESQFLSEVKVFQVYEAFCCRNVTLAVLWNDCGQAAETSGLEAMAIGVDSAQYRSAEKLGMTLPWNDCAAWLRGFEDQIEKTYEASGGDMEIIADVLERRFDAPGYFEDATPFSVQADVFGAGPFTAGDHRQHLLLYLEQLATRMGLRCPETIAHAAVLVIERTIEWARASGNPDAAQTARLLFQCLRSA